MSVRVDVAPSVLTWALDVTGAEAAKLFDQFKVAEWLTAATRPTLKQLQDFARAAGVPFGYLLLPEPMYLLDSNAFMEASRLYYAFDVALGSWAWLGNSDLEGQVASIQAIKDEITTGSGELVEWARARPDKFWLRHTDDAVAAIRDIAATPDKADGYGLDNVMSR